MSTLFLELLSTLLAFAVILLQSQKKTISWPLNLTKKILSWVVFYHKALYIKCFIDSLLIVNSLYAWKKWQNNKKSIKGQVSSLSGYALAGLLIGCSFLSTAIGYFYNIYTEGSWPYFDALHASFILTTYILLAQKKLEAWVVSILANLVYLPVCWQKATYLFFIKYMMYMFMSCYGYYKWYREYVASKKTNSMIHKR